MLDKKYWGEQFGDFPYSGVRRRRADRRKVNWHIPLYWLLIVGFATYGAWESAMRLSGH